MKKIIFILLIAGCSTTPKDSIQYSCEIHKTDKSIDKGTCFYYNQKIVFLNNNNFCSVDSSSVFVLSQERIRSPKGIPFDSSQKCDKTPDITPDYSWGWVIWVDDGHQRLLLPGN